MICGTIRESFLATRDPNGLTALFARNLYANQGGSQEKIPAEIKSEVEPSFSFLETHF